MRPGYMKWVVTAVWLILIGMFSAIAGTGGRPGNALKLRGAGAQIPVMREIDKNVAAIARAIDFEIAQKANALVTQERSLSGYVPDFDEN
jgi:hypothetical protein